MDYFFNGWDIQQGDKGGKRGFVQTCDIIYLHFLSAVCYGENDEKPLDVEDTLF